MFLQGIWKKEKPRKKKFRELFLCCHLMCKFLLLFIAFHAKEMLCQTKQRQSPTEWREETWFLMFCVYNRKVDHNFFLKKLLSIFNLPVQKVVMCRFCLTSVPCIIKQFNFSFSDLKKTLAVLLDNILQRIGKLESKVENLVLNGTGANSTNNTTTSAPSLGAAEKLNVAGVYGNY